MSDGTFDEDIEEITEEIGLMVKEAVEKLPPLRVALAGVIACILLGALASTWYWVIPRDDVEIETVYMQRTGHIILTEIINDGSRAINDVQLDVELLSLDDEVLGSISVSFDSIPSHTSISGNEMELIVRGHTVWADYVLQITVQWTDFNSNEHIKQYRHDIGETAYETFKDDPDSTTWFL
ncbi:MAG: hypothetical protein QGI21_02115 [Candidatus Poseidoniaceae archaeon]|nr:hypothetical protein [Candidatus Poseidoniaceae archaeon]